MDPTALTDADLLALTRACIVEQQRRDTLAQAPAQAEALAATVSTALGRTDGSLWTDHPVTGAHDVWPPSIVCQHPAGEYWRAGRLESHPPGTIGAPWTRVYEDGQGGWTTEPPADLAIEAWDPSKQYLPPAVVAHVGQVWDLIHTNADPGWEPGAPGMHAVWTARTA